MSDYVPFYYASRSLMLYSNHRGNVPTYQLGCERLLFVVTSVEHLLGVGLAPLYTDRNAVLDITDFRDDPADLGGLVDWSVIAAKYWTDFPEGKALRQAECLVPEEVPWHAVLGLAARSQAVAHEAQAVLDTIGETRFGCDVRPDLYF